MLFNKTYTYSNSTHETSALDITPNQLILIAGIGGLAISMLFALYCFVGYHLCKLKREKDRRTFIIANEAFELRLSEQSESEHVVEPDPSIYERLEDGVVVTERGVNEQRNNR